MLMDSIWKKFCVAMLLSAGTGCVQGTTVPSSMPIDSTGGARSTTLQTADSGAPPTLSEVSGNLGEYLAFALANSPETRAAFERWRAARFSISRAGKLPEPNITFGYFLRSVETKVGPQRYKLGVSQAFPWPGKLSAGQDAARERAKAAALVVDANILAIRQDVAELYWTLWLIGEEHRLKGEHDAVLESLAGAVRGRLQTGAASLADLNLVDLNMARHHDHRGHHAEGAKRASAKLRAVIGAPSSPEVLLATEAPAHGSPRTSDEALLALVQRHPVIERFSHLATSEEHLARSRGAERYPRFRVGLDLIGTGESGVVGTADDGKDALVVSAGISVPLWAGTYSDTVSEVRAKGRAHEAMAEAALRRAEGILGQALSNVRNAERRIQLYERTLVPQAEATFQAVLGSYQSGRSALATVIIAQRDLIDLQIEHAGARADHAKFWASLEFITGTQLESKGESHDERK